MGPSYANFFEGFIENNFFSNYHGPKTYLYKRYIDNCVGATSSSREELNLFINSVNSFHPALKYTWEISENSLAFLDIKLSINDNSLSTSVHYKPTDSHNTTCLFAGYPYITGTQKSAKISNKNSFFNWVHSPHTELMNASHSTNLFTHSCDQISTNGKAPLHSHINHNTPQFLYSL